SRTHTRAPTPPRPAPPRSRADPAVLVERASAGAPSFTRQISGRPLHGSAACDHAAGAGARRRPGAGGPHAGDTSRSRAVPLLLYRKAVILGRFHMAQNRVPVGR